MATVNLGRIKPVFRGAYSGGTAYVVDDIVTHGNETYICIQAHGAGTQAVTQTAYWTKLAAKGTDGTDVGTTITTQGDILYRDGSGLQRLAKGTAGQFLKMNTAANAPEWGAVSGGDYVKLASGTVTAVASISIDGYFTSDYDYYRLIILNLRNDTASRQLFFRFNSGGSALTGSNYRWGHDGMYTHTNGSTDYSKSGGWGSDKFQSAWDLSTGADRGSQFEIDIYDPLSTSNEKFVSWKQQIDVTDASYFTTTIGGGYYNDGGGSAMSGITLLPQANNFNTGGKWKLYGIKA